MQKVKISASGPKLVCTRCISLCVILRSILMLSAVSKCCAGLTEIRAVHRNGMFTFPCSSRMHHPLCCSGFVV